MRPGENFEIKCFEYLKNKYINTEFRHEGSMDSTKSDIAVIKKGKEEFYIEVKDNKAQSGQFVLLPDLDSKTFIFSSRNHSKPNEMTKIIIEYMNKDFDKYNSAGTAGENLKIDSSVFSEWIVRHYTGKKVKYIISKNDEYVILPIRKFSEYFEIQAKYRIKKSGSGKPAKKYIPDIIKEIKSYYSTATFSEKDGKLFAHIPEGKALPNFVLGKYTYQLSEQSVGVYEIRRLSNTYNMNVIFSIQLKKKQDSADLTEFESDI